MEDPPALNQHNIKTDSGTSLLGKKVHWKHLCAPGPRLRLHQASTEGPGEKSRQSLSSSSAFFFLYISSFVCVS